MKSRIILNRERTAKAQEISIPIHGKGGELGIKAVTGLVGLIETLKDCGTCQEVQSVFDAICGYNACCIRCEFIDEKGADELAKAGIGGYAGNNNYSGKGIGTAVAKCDMNIRSVAEVKSNTVYSSIKAGTKVEVLEVLANSWYKIVWAGASCGYAYTSNTNNKYYTYTANSKNNSTSTSGSSGLKQTQKPESALCFDKTLAGAYVVTADKLHMRAGAGKTKADYGTIAEGGKVHCYGYYNKEKGTGAKWLYVACGNVTGYCHSDYLKRA